MRNGCATFPTAAPTSAINASSMDTRRRGVKVQSCTLSYHAGQRARRPPGPVLTQRLDFREFLCRRTRDHAQLDGPNAATTPTFATAEPRPQGSYDPAPTPHRPRRRNSSEYFRGRAMTQSPSPSTRRPRNQDCIKPGAAQTGDLAGSLCRHDPREPTPTNHLRPVSCAHLSMSARDQYWHRPLRGLSGTLCKWRDLRVRG